MKTKLLKIINNYGVATQQRKLQEEMFDLQEAITCYEYNDMFKDFVKINFKPIKEEVEKQIAYVCVLLMQITDYYKLDVPTITRYMEKEIDRQLERVKNETNNRMA